jgi:hypothetical protein
MFVIVMTETLKNITHETVVNESNILALICQVKSKAVPLHAMEALGERSYSSCSFTTSALNGVSGQRPALAAL